MSSTFQTRLKGNSLYQMENPKGMRAVVSIAALLLKE